MALDREKFRGIVGGITTPAHPALPEPSAEGGGRIAEEPQTPLRSAAEKKRFAKTGRPKGRGGDPAAKASKVNARLFEVLEPLLTPTERWDSDDAG